MGLKYQIPKTMMFHYRLNTYLNDILRSGWNYKGAATDSYDGHPHLRMTANIAERSNAFLDISDRVNANFSLHHKGLALKRRVTKQT